MRATIYPSDIKGHIRAPSSKSSMQRALAAALISAGKTTIHNPGISNDDLAAIEIIKALGALVEDSDSHLGDLYIESSGVDPISRDINCRESGLSIRMFTPIVALSDRSITITGEGSLKQRPMGFFDEVLPKLGVKVKTNDGKLPIVVQGPLVPSTIEMDGSLSSQFLTGMLMAYAAVGAKGVSIKVRNLQSKPYIDLTLEVMKHFGLNVPDNRDYEEFIFRNDNIKTTGNKQKAIEYTVECDWSGAAFLLVAGAISGPITVTGLDLTSKQADRAIVDVLMAANASIAMEAKGIRVRPVEMNAFEFDASDCPDLFPPLVALAVYCRGTSVISGVGRLRHKESDRAHSLQSEFSKMGVRIDLDDDRMSIHGNGQPTGAHVHSHHDHRIAMALAITSLKTDGYSVIEGAEAVTKSYPDFFKDLKKLNAAVSLSNTSDTYE